MDIRSRDNALLRGVQWEAAMCRLIARMSGETDPGVRATIARAMVDGIRGRGAV